MCSGLCMDIQGSLDHICGISEALESRDAGGTMIRWIVNMLRCRNIHSMYQGESVEAEIVMAFPQRGVLTPSVVCDYCASETEYHSICSSSLCG